MIVQRDSRRCGRAGLFSSLGAGLLLLAPGTLASAAPASPAQSQISSKSTTSRKSSTARKKGHRARGQKVPTPARIREIQSALAREGYYQGQARGKWDLATAEAMKHFQAAQGLNPTGKIDALSLQKLGLGSEIAGLAAPRAAPPPR